MRRARLATVLLAFAAETLAADDLGDRLRGLVAAGFSGTVLVAAGDEILLERAYGDIAGVPMTVESRYWIASVGKQFTAAAILKLVEGGRLGLDDAIGRHLPGVPEDKRAITVRQLLAHVSGLAATAAGEVAADRVAAVAQVVREPLGAPPGSRFQYSNANYVLAAALVEVASGESYGAYLRDRLLAPAGLLDTAQAETAADRARIAPTPGELPPRLTNPGWGGQRWYSTARDLFRWYRRLTRGEVVSSELVRATFEPMAPIGEGAAGLGWFVGRTAGGRVTRFVRGNEDFGANGLVYAYPNEDLVVVVLSHAGARADGNSWSRAALAEIEAALASLRQSPAAP